MPAPTTSACSHSARGASLAGPGLCWRRSSSSSDPAHAVVDNAEIADRLDAFAAVPGIGPKTEAQIVSALARETEARAPRGLSLNRARELVGRIAHALDAEPAGDVRRWCDSCHQLAVVRAASRPDAVLARFAELPQIVAVIEQGDRHAVGVTVDGLPVELTVPTPG